MVGPNACTLQMDHLPTEDGGGSHFVHEWYDVVHFTIVRNSKLLDGINVWPRDAKLREAAGSHGKKRHEACISVRLKCPLVSERNHTYPRLGSHELQGQATASVNVGHGDIRERLCLPPDHRANIQVDQPQSTVARSPRVSRVPITIAKLASGSEELCRMPEMHPAKTGADRVVYERRRESSQPRTSNDIASQREGRRGIRDRHRLTCWKHPPMFRSTAEEVSTRGLTVVQQLTWFRHNTWCTVVILCPGTEGRAVRQ